MSSTESPRQSAPVAGRVAILVLLLLAGALYWPTAGHDFFDLDTGSYITENPHVSSGLTRENIVWAFTNTHSGNWHPLTWMSHMLDCQLFGLEPAGHHLSNVILYLGSILFLFLFLFKATGSVWRSFFASALFGVHPIHVESVAWVAERKDVLSGFFWMLSLLAYRAYTRRPGILRYLALVLAFSLGLLAKQMLVTLPCVLLLLDYWPLYRAGPLSARNPSGRGIRAYLPRPGLVLEKLPLLGLSVAACAATLFAQSDGLSVAPLDEFSLRVRLLNAVTSYLKYMGKAFWPRNLTFFYPHPGESLLLWQGAAALAILLTLSLAAVLALRSRPYFFTGWFWFLGTLVPVIGIIQVGMQGMADRYAYIPFIGLYMAAAWGAPDLLQRCRAPKSAAPVLGALVLFCLIPITHRQIGYWQNTVTLAGRAIEVDDNNYLAYFIMAGQFAKHGHADAAAANYTRTAKIDPCFMARQFNKNGLFKTGQGRNGEAVQDFENALRLCPRYTYILYNSAVASRRMGDLERARASLEALLAKEPENEAARRELRAVLEALAK